MSAAEKIDQANLALLTIREVRGRIGLSQTTIYRLVAAGQFPKPYRVLSRSLWRSDEVTAWIEAKTSPKAA